MTFPRDTMDLADGDDLSVDDWALDDFDEFDDLDGATELRSVRSSMTERHAFDD